MNYNVLVILLILIFITFVISNMKKSKKINVLFIHIPKTGGNAIKNSSFFKNNCSYFGHSRVQNIQWKEYDTSFAFVRNPYDRVVSAFFYLKNGGEKNNKQDKERCKKLLKYKTFKDFTKDLHLFQNEIHFVPQYKFITDDSGKNILVRNILRYEHIDKEYEKFMKSNGYFGENLKKINASKHKHYLSYYDSDSKNIVYSLYKKDFDLFKYNP